MKRGVLVLVFFLLIAGASAEGNFEVNSILLKETLTAGEASDKTITIGRGTGQQVSLEVVGLPGVSLESSDIVLNHDQTVELGVEFDSLGLDPGVYVGSIKIGDDSSVYSLPVIFEVESLDVFYDGNLDIPPKYSEIKAGDQLVAQLKVFDLTWAGITEGLGVNNVDLEYVIYDLEGNVISSESENVVVDKQVNLNKNVGFPGNSKAAEYVLAVEIGYKSSLGTTSQLFTVSEGEERVEKQSLGSLDLNIYVIVLVILFLIVLAIFVCLIKGRDKMILELKRHNDAQFNRNRELILAQERFLVKKGVKRGVARKEAKSKIDVLRKKHEKNKVELKKIGKVKNKKAMLTKLRKWRAKGYNTMGMELKLKNLSNKEMKGIMAGWKKKYSNKKV